MYIYVSNITVLEKKFAEQQLFLYLVAMLESDLGSKNWQGQQPWCLQCVGGLFLLYAQKVER